MNYLIQFLAVLDDSQIQHLKKLRLSRTELNVMNSLLHYGNFNIPKDLLLEKLELTESHFYKVCSVLLDEVYAYFFGDDYQKTFMFLSAKDLYQNLKHEIVQQERKYFHNLDFCLTVYEYLQRGSYKNHDIELIQRYGNQILKLTDEQDYQYFVTTRRIRSELFECAATLNEDRAKILKNRLDEIELELQPEVHPLSYFHLCHAKYNYFLLFEANKLSNEYLEKSLSVYHEKIQVEDKVITSMKLAESFYQSSHFAAAFEKYLTIYKDFPEYFLKDFYHQCKWIQLSLIVNRPENAWEILEISFKRYLQLYHATRGTMAAIHYTKYYIFVQEWKNAQNAILTAKMLNDKNYYVQYEIEIRLLEATVAFYLEDFDYVDSLVKKNFKFLKNKEIKPGESKYFDYLRVIQMAAKQKIIPLKPKKLAELKKLKSYFQDSAKALYGIFLQNICNSISTLNSI